jgi:hypothetical protein
MPNPPWYELAEALSNAVTAIGILVAGVWALVVFAVQRRKEKEAERALREAERASRDAALAHEKERLKWRRARQAKLINDEMLVDRDAMAAMNLVDDDFDVLRMRAKSYKMGVEKVLRALKFDAVDNSDEARATRVAFDAWLYYLTTIQHYIDRKLIDPADLEYPSKYYIGLLRGSEVWPACERYLLDYDIGGKALNYMQSFQAAPRKRRIAKQG